jgi:hypothetical protein
MNGGHGYSGDHGAYAGHGNYAAHGNYAHGNYGHGYAGHGYWNGNVWVPFVVPFGGYGYSYGFDNNDDYFTDDYYNDDFDSEPSTPTAPPPQQFYFCASQNGYYPNVTQCPEGWTLVQPPAPGPGTAP